MTSSLERYGVGLFLCAFGLWLYLKWRDQEPSAGMWCVYLVGVIAWPLLSVWLIVNVVRIRFWASLRLPKDQLSPQHRETLDRLRSVKGKDRY